MKPVTLVVASAMLAMAVPAGAQNPETDRQALERQLADRELQIRRQQQAEQEARIARARDNCVQNRGVDCDSPQGLQEFLILDRSRAEAVLDRYFPPQPPISQPPR